VKIELVRYSQDVSVDTTVSDTTSYLVFRSGTREFRVRVMPETIEDLVRETVEAMVPKPIVVAEVDDTPVGVENDPFDQDEFYDSPPPDLADGVPSV
jgi:hypothetical protein